MKKLTYLLLGVLLSLSLSGCSQSEVLPGTYLLSSSVVSDIEMSYADLQLMGMSEGSYFEVTGKDTAILSLFGEEYPIELNPSTMSFTMEEDSWNYELVEDGIQITGSELLMTFTEENSELWEDILASGSTAFVIPEEKEE